MCSRRIDASWSRRHILTTVVGTMLLIALSLVGVHLHYANSDVAITQISMSETTDGMTATSAVHNSANDSTVFSNESDSDQAHQSNPSAGLVVICVIVLLLIFALTVFLNKPKLCRVRTHRSVKTVHGLWNTFVSKRSLHILYSISRT